MDTIKHYRIIDTIGSGGMGEVLKAFDTHLEREVAIKILHPSLSGNDQYSQRLMMEARAAAKLVHPGVVTIYEVGENERGRFIVMEYVDGQPMTDLIHKEGPLSVERTANLIIQVLKALGLAHKMGIMHRDIKTDNILITHDDQAKILDFGIAKVQAKAGLTIDGQVLGTLEYMAPEQMLGDDVDHRCDLYAVGIILYQALTRQMPFSGQNAVEILFKKLNEEPVMPSYHNKKISSQLDRIILKALQHNKEERWESADEMIKALEMALAEQQFSVKSNWFLENGIGLGTGADENESDQPAQLRSIFIGREKEFKKLISIYQRSKTGAGQTLILSGEAGVGKSTLANQFRNYIDHQKAWLLYGSCLYQEGMDAYLPYIDALRGFFSRENTKISEAQRHELKELVRQRVPILAEFTERFSTTFFSRTGDQKASSEEQSVNLFEGIYLLLSLLSEIRPVVIIIDDLQWADGASLRLFHYLSRQIDNNSLLLVGITRTDRYDLHENGKPKLIADMLSRMRHEGLVKEVRLHRFSHEDCDVLVDKSLGNTAFSEEFYEGIFSETKGNPFFVVETLKLFRENGGIFLEDGIWIDKKIDFKSEVPNRVEDIFLRRLSALENDEREILQVAAVIGYKFDPSLLSQILDIKKITLLKKLQKIEQDSQIISSTDSYFQFEHPMLGDLLYGEIPRALAQEYHLLVAVEIEKIHGADYGAVVGDAAQHFRRGGDHIKAAPLLYQAALRAFDLSAYREASLFFEDLLDSLRVSNQPLTDDIPAKNLYFKLGIAYEEIGQLEQSLPAYQKMSEISSESNEPKNEVEALMRMGRVYDKLGEWDKAANLYKQCLVLAEQNNIENVFSRVYNKIGVYYFHKGDFDEALRYFQKTIRAVDSEYGEYDKAHAFTNVGIIANMMRGSHGVALENFEKALVIYKRLNSRQDQARVYHNMGMFYSDHGEWLESIKAYENCLKLADDVESKHLRALTYLNMGKAYARQKKIAKAKNLTEKAFKMFKRMADILSVAEAYHIFGIIASVEGDFSKAEDYLKDAVKIFKNKEYSEGLADTLESYGHLLLDKGERLKARESYSSALDLFRMIKLDAKVRSLTQLIESIDQGQDLFSQAKKMNFETKMAMTKYETTAN